MHTLADLMSKPLLQAARDLGTSPLKLALTAEQSSRPETKPQLAAWVAAALEPAAEAYTNDEDTLMEDPEFDGLRDMLRRLDPGHDFLKKVGATPKKSGIWPKVTHSEVMGSLEKEKTLDDLRVWYEKYTQGEVILMDKLDGNSTDLKYETILNHGASRGDGEIGDLITPNILRMQVPTNLPIPNRINVRGEILLQIQTWIDEFLKKTPPNKKPPKNPRNSASGTSRRSDGIGCEHMMVYAYKLKIDGAHPYGNLRKKSDQLDILQQLGFHVPRYKVAKTFDEVVKHLEDWEKLRPILPYEIDGVVIEDNDTAFVEAQGMSDNRPRAARAYKFAAQFAETSPEEVIWQTGRSGVIAPVGRLRPTDIGGVTITRVSLCNLAEIYRLKLGIGSTARLERANDVIPKITEVLTPGEPIIIPKECPSCKQPTTVVISLRDEEVTLPTADGMSAGGIIAAVLSAKKKTDDSLTNAVVECRNDACPARAASRILHYLATLDVKGFGDRLVEKLMEAGKINTPSDLYKLYVGDIADLEGGSEKVAIKVLRDLKDKSDGVTLPRFVKSLGMDLVGESFTEIAMSKFPTLDDLRKATFEELSTIPRIGPAVAQAMVDGLKEKTGLIDALLPHVRITKLATGPLTGSIFCFTGVRDKDAEVKIVELGGKVSEGYSKAITHLVCKDPNGKSGKLDKARKDGKKIIGIDDLPAMITTS